MINLKIVQINSFSNGSTGKIMMSIHQELLNNGYESYVIWGRGRKAENENEVYLNDRLGVYFHVLYARLTGKNGYNSQKSTEKLLKKLNEIEPDIIHLHNIHGYYINIEMLFNYIKDKKIKVIWTLHDCWPFTGQCAYFTFVNCNKWKKCCDKCDNLTEYPKTFKDNSKWNYDKKKELFGGLNMKIITPSKWLAQLVKQSFLKEYPIEVINNGINTSIFKPTTSEFRKEHKLENKKIILGVASVWDKRKGLSDFIKLSEILDDNYKIVLIGLNKKQKKKLPKKIIGITRTENQQKLAEIYSTSDILFNPTYEDNYPTINLEAIACKTPVLTYDTGGSPEFVDFLKDNNIKYTIEKKKVAKNIELIKKYIDSIIEKEIELKDLNLLDEKTMTKKYLNTYYFDS